MSSHKRQVIVRRLLLLEAEAQCKLTRTVILCLPIGGFDFESSDHNITKTGTERKRFKLQTNFSQVSKLRGKRQHGKLTWKRIEIYELLGFEAATKHTYIYTPRIHSYIQVKKYWNCRVIDGFWINCSKNFKFWKNLGSWGFPQWCSLGSFCSPPRSATQRSLSLSL